MTKFNLELRISIVTQYLTGISSIQLARKYHIANNETILLWFIALIVLALQD
nr:transposase [Secundilactobacillus oryzae]